MSVQPTTEATKASGTSALVGVLKPIIDEGNKNQMIQITALFQELLLGQNRIEAKQAVLENLFAGVKKAPSKAKEPKAEAAAEATAETVVTTAPTKTFTNNIAVYFKNQYAASPEFRAKYLSDEAKGIMESDKKYLDTLRTAKGEKNDTEKLKAQAAWMWTYISKTQTETNIALLKAYNTEFNLAKANDADANKPAQLTAESVTPK